MENCNIVRFQGMREIKDNFHIAFQRKLQVTRDLVKRLSLETELEGHLGCVNCLQWNEAGNLLASGSDDLNIILWTPFLGKKVHTIQSGHHGNIFSVKFVPGTNDHCIVSGAADFKIRVNNYTSDEVTFSCCCHGGRVKRLATAANVPHMFWSAAEDGMILQFDLRTPHQCSNICSNVLVNLVNHLGRSAEAKCIAINPVNPDLIAVGANDPYVRMYDRRMIKPITARFHSDLPSSPWDLDPFSGEPLEPEEDNLTSDSVSYFVAGHLPLKLNDFKRRYRSLTATYVTFSPDGKDLLANLGGEQIYLFSVISRRKQMVFDMSERALNFAFDVRESCDDLKMDCCDEYHTSRIKGTNGLTNGISHHSTNCLHKSRNYSSLPQKQNASRKSAVQNLPKHVNDVKICANQAFEQQDYNLAISLYNSAIVMCPNAACLYANRAAAYIKRAWDGDYYAAIRDCYSALDLDPDYLKAHFRLAQCLHKLNWAKEAYDCLQGKLKMQKPNAAFKFPKNDQQYNFCGSAGAYTEMEAFRIKFPQYSVTRAFEAFEDEVKIRMFAQMSRAENNENESEDDTSSTASGHNFTSLPGLSLNSPISSVSELEKIWRTSAYDYEYRYCGHCNTTTDIKEANFFGSYGEFIVAGSDDGSIFIWDRVSTNIVRVLRGDDSIVNCLQPHPTTCMLATSGIDPVVRLWSPRAEDGSKDEREVLDKDDAAFANQRRMNADPLEIMLLNMGYRLPGVLEQMSEDLESRPGSDRNVVQCRTS